MKQLFSLAVLLATAALPAAPPVIDKLEYPEKVKAGETFTLTITATGAPGENLSYSFNGETRIMPPDYRNFAAKEFLNRYSKLEADGSVTAASDYHMLLTIPVPPGDGSRTVWVRAAGGNLCLRTPKKELKWNFGKSETFRWINFGRFDRATLGDKLCLMAEKPPYARVDRIILTGADAKSYKPEGDGAPPNLFRWTPDASAIGKHEFTVSVSTGTESAEQKISVTVLPAAPLPPPDAKRIAPEKQRRIDLAALTIPAEKYPLFAFRTPEYRRMVTENAFGLAFSGDEMIALRCNAATELPQSVDIPVNAKAAMLALLLSQYWQGDVGQEMAHITVNYADGARERIPLREEFELCGSLRNREPQAAAYAGTVSSGSIEFNLSIQLWPNPHPEREIRSLTFSNLRTVISREENQTIPLNVTAESSQLLLGLVAITDADAAKQLAVGHRANKSETSDAAVTVNFAVPAGKIHPAVFSTNETDVQSGDHAKFDDYLEKMKTVNCKLYRFHSGWNLQSVYPEQLKNPQYEKLAATIAKLKSADPQWDVMICFNSIPSYIDPKTPEGRKLFADLCADLVRELNVNRKFGLKYWEIYNEVYFKKIDDDRALWHMYNESAAAMRKVDPSIKIGGYAPCWPVLANIRDFYRNCHGQTDFISYHKYLTGSTGTPTEYLMDKTATFGDDARRIREAAREITPDKPVELALTEYNINFNWKPHDPRQATIVGAAWFASVLNHLIRADVEIAQTWHSRSGGTFGLFSDDNEPRPAAVLFALANRYLKGEYYTGNSTSPRIECLGFRHPDAAGCLVINKSDREFKVKLNLLNPPKFAAARLLPDGESLSLTADGLDVRKTDPFAANPVELTLRPYEVRLLTAPTVR